MPNYMPSASEMISCSKTEILSKHINNGLSYKKKIAAIHFHEYIAAKVKKEQRIKRYI